MTPEHPFPTVLLALAALPALMAAPAAGQTPLTSVGLGYPVAPVDGRAAALGGVGVGLLGGTTSVRNPADLVEFGASEISITAAPEGVEIGGPAGSESADRSRFSVIRAVVPLGAWAASVGFAGELDQDWSFRHTDTLEVSTGRFPFTEQREEDGGVSAVDFSLARSVGPLSLGVSYQLLTGSLRQRFRRTFETSVDLSLPAPKLVDERARWDYRAHRLRAGAGLQLGDRLRLSGAYSTTGNLTAEWDSLGISRTVPMPDDLVVGASARPVSDVLLTAGGGWSGWSDADGALSRARARDVVWFGGGVELSWIELGSTPILLRAGGRHAELPFAPDGRGQLTEQAATFGVGVYLLRGRGSLDASLDVGTRGDAPATGVEENFQRLTLTATIRQ